MGAALSCCAGKEVGYELGLDGATVVKGLRSAGKRCTEAQGQQQLLAVQERRATGRRRYVDGGGRRVFVGEVCEGGFDGETAYGAREGGRLC